MSAKEMSKMERALRRLLHRPKYPSTYNEPFVCKECSYACTFNFSGPWMCKRPIALSDPISGAHVRYVSDLCMNVRQGYSNTQCEYKAKYYKKPTFPDSLYDYFCEKPHPTASKAGVDHLNDESIDTVI